MTARPIPADLLPWALSALGQNEVSGDFALSLVAGDASNRRYFRLCLPGDTFIVVESPPATEKNAEFLAVREVLEKAGIHVPCLYAADLERGYLLLEDLGDRTLLPELTPETVDTYYARSFGLLQKMAQLDPEGLGQPLYDRALLVEELGRCPEWFVECLLGHSLHQSERALFDRLSSLLVDSALEQPRVLVHRDFHSRNLMLLPGDELGVIDFQDAVVGPVTYDLVSLLRDCYIQWPQERVRDWALAYRSELIRQELMSPVDESVFLRWFDWMGLQRHIKVLGTFARLYLRDGKPGYLDDLPLVIKYVGEVLTRYVGEEAVFEEFTDWFEASLGPQIAAQPWSEKS